AESSPEITLADERAVIRVADAIDRAVDAQDWRLARSYFADRVTVDFSSLSGQPAATIASDDLIGTWAANLRGNKTSLHLRTNHQVAIDGDAATVSSNGYAWNRMEGNGEPLWEVWGTYEHHLTRSGANWSVDGFTFRMTHERGNPWVKTTPGQDRH
ncbi:nuclear transport factor 2 family protein, partial [Mesorhizobium sp. M7A.F.Ca.MR.362.00.0.0]|uniref:nuclear transport factor 2 family protein n=1 Tax=Mesorhizobium sp. M7A.F.Ca.MR.362.00.0.0 TaxID=2496779 RepID=UPI000FD2FB8D